MNIIRKYLFEGLLFAGDGCRYLPQFPIRQMRRKSSRRERGLNSPFSRQMTFMVIWMTSSRWMMEPFITIQLRSMPPSLKDVRNEEENVLLVDGGDVFLRGEFQAGQGELETSLLKALDYDAMALGNNDFRVYPSGEGTPDSRYEQLKDYHRNVNFPILTGNVINRETGKYIQNVKPWKSFTFSGVKVGDDRPYFDEAGNSRLG